MKYDVGTIKARHKQHLEQALMYLNNFSKQRDLILAVEEIRLTITCFQSITGEITVDEILGEIFNNFCIGK